MADKPISGMPVDASLGGAERMLAQGADGSVVLVSALAAYAVDQLHSAAVITSLVGTDEVVIFKSDVEKIITVTNMAAWVIDTVEAVGVSTIVDADWIIFSDAGVLKKITLANLAASFTNFPITVLDIDGGSAIGAALVDADLLIVDDGAVGTNVKCTMAEVFAYIEDKIQALAGKATPIDADFLAIQDTVAGALKSTTVLQLWDNRLVEYLKAITNVASATFNWTVDEDDLTSNLDTKVPTQQSVKAYVDASVGPGPITDLTPLAAVPDVLDFTAISDESAVGDPTVSVTITEFLSAAGDLTDLGGSPEITFRLLVTDEDVAGEPAKSMSVQNLFDAVNAKLAQFTGAIVPGTDQILIDDGATTKRVTYQVFIDGIGDLTAEVIATTDTLVFTDADGVAKIESVDDLFGIGPALVAADTVDVATDYMLFLDGGATGAANKCTIQSVFDGINASNDMTPGTGISTGTNTICEHSIATAGGLIKTEILIDLTGLRSGGAAGDIIGKSGGTVNCHIGQITSAKNGTIIAGRVTCHETPAGGDPDVDIWGSATEATGAQDAPIAGLTNEVQLIDHGDWAAGSLDILTALPSNGYLYLACGAITDVDYTAGIILVELWGT